MTAQNNTLEKIKLVLAVLTLALLITCYVPHQLASPQSAAMFIPLALVVVLFVKKLETKTPSEQLVIGLSLVGGIVLGLLVNSFLLPCDPRLAEFYMLFVVWHIL